MTGVWQSLDRIEWARLRHHRGTAADFPGLLHDSAGDDPRRARTAIDILDDALTSGTGGWISPAATAALPFLADLATGTARHHRDLLIDLVDRLLLDGTDAGTDVDAGWAAVVHEVTPRLLTVLDDPDPDIRRAGLEMIRDGFLPPDQFRAHVQRRWQTETDPRVRLYLIGYLDDPTVWQRLLDHGDPHEQLAALHALARTDPTLPLTRIPQMIAAVRAGGGVHAGRLLAADPVAHTTFLLATGTPADRDERVAGLEQAGRLLATWRHLDPLLHDMLIDRLTDDDPEIRFQAAHLLACVPTATAADTLATLAADTTVRDSPTGVTVGDAAVWALTRLHDRRCLPWLRRRLIRAPASGLPPADEMLTPLAGFADDLADRLPALAPAARCRILAAWASPHGVALLIPLLSDRHVAGAAAHALGRIGHPAQPAAGLLREHPWAYWRVTGDPAPLLAAAAGPWDRPMLRHLADLGPLAHDAAPRLHGLIRSSDDEAVRADAAWARYRITGDLHPIVAAVARPLHLADATPARVRALQRLASIGPAAGDDAVAVARLILDSPRRFYHQPGRHRFHTDERLRTAAARLLTPQAAKGCGPGAEPGRCGGSGTGGDTGTTGDAG